MHQPDGRGICAPWGRSRRATGARPSRLIPAALTGTARPRRDLPSGSRATDRPVGYLLACLTLLTVVGIGVVESAAGVPLRALVTVCGDAARVLEQAGHVQKVPGHEGRVAVGEVVLRPARAGIEVAGPGADLAEPRRVGLGWDHVAEVLQRVEHVHRAVLRSVLVAGDQAAGRATVVGILAVLVEEMAVSVEALDHLGAYRRFLAEPDRTEEHEDVGGDDLREDRRPVVPFPSMFGHVGLHTGRDVVIDRANRLHRDA